MAGITRLQTRPGKGRAGSNSWGSGGSQAASMSGATTASVLDLARARRPAGDTGQEGSKRKGAPGDPSVTAAAARRRRAAAAAAVSRPDESGLRSVRTHPAPGANPGESRGSLSHTPSGSNVTQGSALNQGPATADIPTLIQQAKSAGAQTTAQHLARAAASFENDDYEKGIQHLANAHDTAKAESSAALINGVAKRLRQMKRPNGATG